jgi:hypothetical protein
MNHSIMIIVIRGIILNKIYSCPGGRTGMVRNESFDNNDSNNATGIILNEIKIISRSATAIVIINK